METSEEQVKTETMFALKVVGTDNNNETINETKETFMNYYADLSDNTLFSMMNKTSHYPTKQAIKKELKSRGYLLNMRLVKT